MRLAVAGDIHSNSVAFSAFAREIRRIGVDGAVFTGDLVSDCAYPERTASLLRELMEEMPVYAVKGNREVYLMRHRDNPDEFWPYDSHSGSVRYTYESLSEEEREFLFALPETREIQLPGCDPFFLCHGSPVKARELMFPGEENTKAHLEACPCPLLVCGHSHSQIVYEWAGKTLLNPGSLGMPIEGSTHAQYALLEWTDSGWRAELKCIPYDNELAIAEIETCGLLEKSLYWARCIRKSLRMGENYLIKCILLAEDLMKADGRVPDYGHIPTEYWAAAAKQLGIE